MRASRRGASSRTPRTSPRTSETGRILIGDCVAEMAAMPAGSIDLAFAEQGRWVVVDFKSDSGNTARYERQLQWYLYGLSKITGWEAEGHLLRL